MISLLSDTPAPLPEEARVDRLFTLRHLVDDEAQPHRVRIIASVNHPAATGVDHSLILSELDFFAGIGLALRPFIGELAQAFETAHGFPLSKLARFNLATAVMHLAKKGLQIP